jgi:hypothetical protein
VGEILTEVSRRGGDDKADKWGPRGGDRGRRGRVGRKVGRAEIKKKRISELKIGFLNLPRLWKFVEGDLGGILT